MKFELSLGQIIPVQRGAREFGPRSLSERRREIRDLQRGFHGRQADLNPDLLWKEITAAQDGIQGILKEGIRPAENTKDAEAYLELLQQNLKQISVRPPIHHFNRARVRLGLGLLSLRRGATRRALRRLNQALRDFAEAKEILR